VDLRLYAIHIVNQMLHDAFEREYVHVVGHHEEDMDGRVIDHGIESKNLVFTVETPLFTMVNNTKCSHLIVILLFYNVKATYGWLGSSFTYLLKYKMWCTMV